MTDEMVTQLEEKERFNNAILNEEVGGRKPTLYTWIVRWQSSSEYGLNLNEKLIEPAKKRDKL